MSRETSADVACSPVTGDDHLGPADVRGQVASGLVGTHRNTGLCARGYLPASRLESLFGKHECRFGMTTCDRKADRPQ
jgi:hypothetical protein